MAAVHPAAVVATAQPLLQDSGRGSECRVEIGAERLAAHRGTLAPAGDLDPLTYLRLARVLFVVQHDIITDDVAVVATEAGQFFGPNTIR